MTNFFSNMELSDYVYACIAAAFVMFIIKRFIKTGRSIRKRPMMLAVPPIDLAQILKKCYSMFPDETVSINGMVFHRGMNVRITTNENKTFEGHFIGRNNDNIYCVLTKTAIATDILDNVASMAEIEEAGGQ